MVSRNGNIGFEDYSSYILTSLINFSEKFHSIKSKLYLLTNSVPTLYLKLDVISKLLDIYYSLDSAESSYNGIVSSIIRFVVSYDSKYLDDFEYNRENFFKDISVGHRIAQEIFSGYFWVYDKLSNEGIDSVNGSLTYMILDSLREFVYGYNTLFDELNTIDHYIELILRKM